ncbi:MAG: type II toxin-antitoxin system Phd/YefM family antitoxin [Prochloron sp. SP5CPC1]|nr:type II toxin-antitoxin system Phd/YefM family antitoxin [Candidatus Paraprochloron terpiosi SP5CPC1]
MNSVATQPYVSENQDILPITIPEAQTKLTDIVERVHNKDERIILIQDGKEMAAIISMEAFSFLEQMIHKMEDEMDRRAILEARNQRAGNITLEKLKQELGL